MAKDNQLSKIVCIRMTQEDYNLIKDKNKSEYIRSLIQLRNAPNKNRDIKKELLEMNHFLKKIGNNINQITRNNNSGFYDDDDKIILNDNMNEILEKFIELKTDINNL